MSDVDDSFLPLRARGPDAIMHGEYSVVFLREPDHCRLRYGLVTRDAEGRLKVCDPAIIADAVGDDAAQFAWSKCIDALLAWAETKEEQSPEYRNTVLIDTDAVEKMFEAATWLASRREEIKKELRECETVS